MSTVVRLHVPPFEPAAPTSLAALRRPLIQAETVHCEAQCQPCPVCVAKQAAEVETAMKLSSDLGLRVSQLVEDALSHHIARIEAQQAELIASVLTGVLPHLADAALRSALTDELSDAAEPLRTEPLRLRKHPELDLGPLADDTRLEIEDDASLALHQIQLRDGEGVTQIDPDRLITACLARLGQPAPETRS